MKKQLVCPSQVANFSHKGAGLSLEAGLASIYPVSCSFISYIP